MTSAEPFDLVGDGTGVVCVHGFTGTPYELRYLGEQVASAGFAAVGPLLPGHGTTVEDMLDTSWADWSAAAERAYTDLASRCDKVVVAGLSMGGTLTCWLAIRYPEIAGIVVKIASDHIELRSREYSRIVVRIESIDAAALA